MASSILTVSTLNTFTRSSVYRSPLCVSFSDFLSHYCNGKDGNISMGITPYYQHSLKKLTEDSSSVADVFGADSDDLNETVTNCTITFYPPPGQALLVSPHILDIAQLDALVMIHIDHQLIWLWHSQYNKLNGSLVEETHSSVNGTVRISILINSMRNTWRRMKLHIVLTAFIRKSP